MAGKRLGWWPGQVQNVEKLRQDLAADVTDKTIAVVKYLNEDNYQFVEDKTIICAYNADQKEEYISLGMSKLNRFQLATLRVPVKATLQSPQMH